MKVSMWMASSVLCAVLLVVSLYGCYSFIRMPLSRYSNNVDLRYTQSADYGYTAFVEPSLLYDNRTEISEGEPLYTKLVEQIEIVLKYELKQTPSPVEMTGIEVGYETSAVLSGGDWKKIYPLSVHSDSFRWLGRMATSLTSNASGFTETYTLNMTEIEEIVETIGEETGIRTHSYSYEIKPSISLEASAGREIIEQEFNPTLKVKFEGGKIEFEGLSSTKTGSVTHRETEVATYNILGSFVKVIEMRGISSTAALLLSGLLFYSGRNTLRERESRTFMERLSEEVREKIVEVKVQEPWESTARETMRVNSLEDLARVAEESFKTIIHHGDVFYVLDGDVRYEYKIEAEPDVEEVKEKDE